jgi:lipoprotein-anchoring transpeptidase ErfK/SrfK
MNSRLIAASLLAVMGMTGAVNAQYYPSQPGYGQPVYPPGTVLVPPGTAPPPGYVPVQPSYRGRLLVENDDALPAPGPYGRPSGYQNDGSQRPPTAIQQDALPPPAGAEAPQYQASPQYQEPARQEYGYGTTARPPGDVAAPGVAAAPASGYGAAPAPGLAAPQSGYGTPGPGYGLAAQPPGAQPNGYAALPPDYQPEVGKPKELPPQFRRQLVDFPTKEPSGTLIVDTPNTYLYLVMGNGKAIRYGIGVGREGFTWTGRERISRMSEWPDWHPPKEMIERQPYLPRFMAGGESNPLGARALYLGNTLYRIHGTNQPSTIGTFVSSGCIRLTNDDISDLYSRVQVGTKVVVWPRGPETTASVAH